MSQLKFNVGDYLAWIDDELDDTAFVLVITELTESGYRVLERTYDGDIKKAWYDWRMLDGTRRVLSQSELLVLKLRGCIVPKLTEAA